MLLFMILLSRMASARSRKILDLIDNKGSPHYQEHDQVSNKKIEGTSIPCNSLAFSLNCNHFCLQANTVPNEPIQNSEILSDRSIDVQVTK